VGAAKGGVRMEDGGWIRPPEADWDGKGKGVGVVI
jgi:hypothetical protein